MGHDLRQVAKLAADLDAGLELAAEDHQGAVDPIVDVDLLHRRLVEVGILLERFDDVGDAAGAVPDLRHEVIDVVSGCDRLDRGLCSRWGEFAKQLG